ILYSRFPEARTLVEAYNTDVHRVRFMKLLPGGGEIERHTDSVDPDSGFRIGKLARLHFPIVTNPKVTFTIWDIRDRQINEHYQAGDCFVLDTQFPHRVINEGVEDRIHLVVDLLVNKNLRDTILSGFEKYNVRYTQNH
ncbi:MAG: aspartyl/asparaginyl beta-hydroxylase domain-containing protein, partial [Thermodesulfobacteriota bacterium]